MEGPFQEITNSLPLIALLGFLFIVAGAVYSETQNAPQMTGPDVVTLFQHYVPAPSVYIHPGALQFWPNGIPLGYEFTPRWNPPPLPPGVEARE